MRVRILWSRHLLNQNRQCAEATEGLSPDTLEDGSGPDFAPRATLSAGRSKDMIIVRTKDSKEGVVLEGKIAVCIGGPADDIAVRIGGLEGDTVVRDGDLGMAFARSHSSFAPDLPHDGGPDMAFAPGLSRHALKPVRLQDYMVSTRAIFNRCMDNSTAVLGWTTRTRAILKRCMDNFTAVFG